MEVVTFPMHRNSLVCALLHQRAQHLNIDTNFCSTQYEVLCGKIRNAMQELECYPDITPVVVQHPTLFRVLTRYLQTAIRVYHPDGYIRSYPFTFRSQETYYNVYYDQNHYSSVKNVSKVIYSPNLSYSTITRFRFCTFRLRVNRAHFILSALVPGTHKEEFSSDDKRSLTANALVGSWT